MKKIFNSAIILASLCLASCSKDDDQPITPGNNVEVPAEYTFTRNGESTVSFEGQTTRILMASELVGSFNDFETATEISLHNQFVNENNPFANEALNASNKNIKSKVAASYDYFSANTAESAEIKADFENYIDLQINQVFPNQLELAAPGVAGQIADGEKVRYVNAKGLELNQAFAKSLIGAMMTDQILNNYLSFSVLDEGANIENNNAEVLVEGESYTSMEHKWDEAYGYVYGTSSNPANPNPTLDENRFLAGYINSVDSDADFAGIKADIFNAFKKGRAAIVAGNYEVRDAQIAILREKISTVIAVRAIHYLQEGAAAIENGTPKNGFHALSEGFGFVYSLRFTRNPVTDAPYFSSEEVNAYTSTLLNGNGFWDLTPETLNTISAEIATEFGFTVEAAAH